MRMLADKQRNLVFASAIQDACREHVKAHVLDIGAGSGLLSVLSVKAGAERVHAIEMSLSMCDICQAVLENNGCQECVSVHQCHSTALQVKGTDNRTSNGVSVCTIPRRVDVVVSETVDSGLLGERTWESLSHAYEHLLVPGGTLIPRSAQLWFACIESPMLSQSLSVQPDLLASIGIGSASVVVSEEVQSGKYDCCRLDRVAHKYLSEVLPGPVIAFDTKPHERTTTVAAVALHRGVLHAVCSWYTLSLSRTKSLCTAPGAGTHWEQAVHAVVPPLQVEEGQRLLLKVHVSASSVRVTVDQPLPVESPIKHIAFEPYDIALLNDKQRWGSFGAGPSSSRSPASAAHCPCRPIN